MADQKYAMPRGRTMSAAPAQRGCEAGEGRGLQSAKLRWTGRSLPVLLADAWLYSTVPLITNRCDLPQLGKFAELVTTEKKLISLRVFFLVIAALVSKHATSMTGVAVVVVTRSSSSSCEIALPPAATTTATASIRIQYFSFIVLLLRFPCFDLPRQSQLLWRVAKR